MQITIGMLARDESEAIARTIASLFEQSVFNPGETALPDARWEVVVVPNGCQDDTHACAEQALQVACAGRRNVAWRVVSLEQGGKSGAWNKLVHEISAPSTEVFVMIDADVEFGHTDTIANCVQRLRSDDHARAVVDLPLKDFHRKSRHTLIEALSLRASRERVTDTEPGIAGSFYVMWAPYMRSIWMPIDLSVEDGFLYAMVITDNFRHAPEPSRVVRAANATHYYKGLTSLRDIVNHEARLLVGAVLNAFLCWDVLLFMTPREGPGAGEVVRALNQQDPIWYRRMMINQITIRGGWVLRLDHLWRHLPEWWALPLGRRIVRLPMLLAWMAFDIVVMWQANRKLVRHAIGYW